MSHSNPGDSSDGSGADAKHASRTAANGDTQAVRRFPRSVFSVGSEPDPRFTLANERTFLAWIRTSLALIAGSVGLEALSLPIEPGLRRLASVVLIVLALLTCLEAWYGWQRTERAMRQGAPLPSTPIAGVLAVGIMVVGVLIAVGSAIYKG